MKAERPTAGRKPNRGMSNHLIDGKSRLAIPTDFRTNLVKESIEDGHVRRQVVMSLGFRRTLALWHPDEWDLREARRGGVPQTNAQQFLATATYVLADVDPQYRIRIPVDTRKLCSLPKEQVTVAGAGDHVLVWDSDRLNEFINTESKALESSDGSPSP